MDIVKENDRFAEDRNIRPRQRSGFECFIIMLLVAFLAYFMIFSETPVMPWKSDKPENAGLKLLALSSFACPVGKLFPAGLFFVTEMFILSKKYRQGV